MLKKIIRIGFMVLVAMSLGGNALIALYAYTHDLSLRRIAEYQKISEVREFFPQGRILMIDEGKRVGCSLSEQWNCTGFQGIGLNIENVLKLEYLDRLENPYAYPKQNP